MTGLLALVFAAGMIAPVNPCGFALLPAWITYALGDADTSPLPVRLVRAVRSGTALTFGFAGTLVAAGLIVSAGARALIHAAPWLGLAIGIILLLLGALMLTGWTLRLPVAVSRSNSGRSTGPVRLAAFGAGYAAASLSCTFGVLLAVIAQAQATASYAGLLSVFGAYAAGSATVLLLVSISTAAAGAPLTRRITALARHGTRITAIILVLTGAYVAWYWFPAVTGGNATAQPGVLAGFSTTVSIWIQAHTTHLALLAAAAVLVVAALALRHRLRSNTGNRLTATARHGIGGEADTDCCARERASQPVAAPTPREGDTGGPCC